MFFFKKYMKYKNKYLKLKEQSGGAKKTGAKFVKPTSDSDSDSYDEFNIDTDSDDDKPSASAGGGSARGRVPYPPGYGTGLKVPRGETRKQAMEREMRYRFGNGEEEYFEEDTKSIDNSSSDDGIRYEENGKIIIDFREFFSIPNDDINSVDHTKNTNKIVIHIKRLLEHDMYKDINLWETLYDHVDNHLDVFIHSYFRKLDIHEPQSHIYPHDRLILMKGIQQQLLMKLVEEWVKSLLIENNPDKKEEFEQRFIEYNFNLEYYITGEYPHIFPFTELVESTTSIKWMIPIKMVIETYNSYNTDDDIDANITQFLYQSHIAASKDDSTLPGPLLPLLNLSLYQYSVEKDQQIRVLNGSLSFPPPNQDDTNNQNDN